MKFVLKNRGNDTFFYVKRQGPAFALRKKTHIVQHTASAAADENETAEREKKAY
jgi:hypothetical protein